MLAMERELLLLQFLYLLHVYRFLVRPLIVGVLLGLVGVAQATGILDEDIESADLSRRMSGREVTSTEGQICYLPRSSPEQSGRKSLSPCASSR